MQWKGGWAILTRPPWNCFEKYSFMKVTIYQNRLKKKKEKNQLDLKWAVSLHVRSNLQFWIRNQWPRDTHCFGVCSWEGVEAKPGMSECEDSASLVGRELMRPLLGNSPEMPAIGLLNQQHVQCTSRRGIWHLNFPWTFHHHHLQLLHMWAASSCREIFQGRPAERGRVSSWASAWGSLTQQTPSRGLPTVCLCLCMQRRPPRQASTKPCGWMSFSLRASVLCGLIPRVALLEEVRPLGDGLVTGLIQTGSSNHGPEVP